MNTTADMALNLIPEKLQFQPDNGRIHYLSVPPGYRIWQKTESRLELAVSMIRHVMPVFHEKKNVIILCDSWYVKKKLVSIIYEYENLDIIGNAMSDSVIYDLPPQRTGKTFYSKRFYAV